MTAGALNDFFTTDTFETYGSAVAGSVVKEIVDNAGGASMTIQDIVDGVWDEDITTHHTVSGSAGDTLNIVPYIAEMVWDEDMTTHIFGGTAGYYLNDVVNIPDNVWEMLLVGHTNTGTFGDAIGDLLAASAPSDATIADAVWDEAISGHLTSGTTGAALNAAGAAGDPWSTSLPGAYGSGTAGKIIGDNINATISSRATQTSVDTVDDFLDTEIAAIKTKTDFLPSATAGAAGGLFIAGTNAATTVTTSFTTTFTGNLTGSVASVTGAVGSVTGAVGSVTGNVGGNVTGSVGSVTGAVGSVTGNVGGSVASIATGGITSGSFAAGAITNAAFANSAITSSKIGTDAIGAAQLATDAVTEIGTGVWATTTRVLTANTNLNDLNAAGIRAAVGLASANLDTQLSTIDDFLDTEIAAIKTQTDLIPGTQDGKTFAETTLLMASVLLGKASGLATTTGTFRALDDSQNRVTATIDADGNRTAMTYDTTSP
jgi:hypothetical protein